MVFARGSLWALVCASGLACSCQSDEMGAHVAVPAPSPQCTPGLPGCAPAPLAGSTAPSQAGVTGALGAGSGAVAPTSLGVPCGVASIVSAHCTGCHQSPTKLGAPMPLTTLEHFHATAVSDPSKQVFETIPARLDPVDPTKRMPQPPLPALGDLDKQTLGAWLAAGAQGVASSCAIEVRELTPVGTIDGGMPTIESGSGGAHIEAIEYDDPDMRCHKFLTHAAGDKAAPYVQGFGEAYVNFSFAAPWDGTVYLRATKLANDPNSQVIHHWLLFKQGGPVTDGAITPGSGIHPDGTLIHAWGPGASPIYFDPDVGVPLESDVGYLLEAHFNNSGGGSGEDQSGAELCVTPHAPEHIAELVWVGSDSIFGTSATGTCRPRGPFPIHVIAAQPHMHKLGVHMNVVVNRAGGGMDVVHDLDFSFDSQQYYVKDFVLEDGDSMVTRCTYSGPARFGPSTSDEMCYFFSLAWPAGALRGGAGGFIHGPNSCL
jgi:hypothetical protein